MSKPLDQERLMTVVLGPHVSEKTTIMADKHNQVVFRVRRDSNKVDIRRAVELLFSVKVEQVQVVNCRGKIKRSGNEWGRRQNWKKAYVTLAEGDDIDFMGPE
ncbi:MAG: 50S ribosomal protein L23 [Pseudomonadota bacterium]|jgi:large subunit ribosomal protein L23|nr:50S ribosomal protein L23 [Pseudomonadota bacterium]